MPHAPRLDAGQLSLVFIGGAIGTLVRAGVGQLWFDPAFPWATLAVNLIGSWALGMLAGSLQRRPDDVLRNLVGLGLLGALTTFSTFAVEIVELGRMSGPGAALAYAGFSVTLGIWLASSGFRRGVR